MAQDVVELRLETPDGLIVYLLVDRQRGLPPRSDPPDPGQAREAELIRVYCEDGKLPDRETSRWAEGWFCENSDAAFDGAEVR
jgi:hypothetical protein